MHSKERSMVAIPTVEVEQLPADGYLLDVREDDEWTAGHAPGAVHIPLGQLGGQADQVPKGQPVYVICRAGGRSARAVQVLGANGWDVTNVSDGMQGWEAAGRPMTSESGAPPFVA
jgi:rhodanese-related sulfurtransferase